MSSRGEDRACGPDTDPLLVRIAALEQERDELLAQSKNVAEANVRAAMHLVSRNTELEQQESRLRKALAEAERASRMKEEFLAKVSHELRTPMNGILGMTRFLLETQLTEEQTEFAETVHDSADSLLVIINELLDFSSLAAGKLKLVNEPFDLWKLVEDSLRLHTPGANSKDLFFDVIVDNAAQRYLVGDRGRLRQVLMNLCGNAVKFTDAGSVIIRVSPSPDSSEVWISVEDTGLGIPESDLSSIFDPFNQVDNSASRGYGGTGLGLTISRELVASMGGHIEVSSKAGIGSVFSIRLPITDLQIPRETIQRARFDSCAFCVSDDSTRSKLKSHLNALGLTVHCCSSLTSLLHNSPSEPDRNRHLVLVDLEGLGETERMELARAAREELAEASVVLLLPVAGNPGTDLQSLQSIRTPLRVTELHQLITNPGKGTPSENQRDRPSTQSPDLTGLSVLLVEDNPVNQCVAKRMLERLGCNANVAENGQVCLEMLLETAPDIVLMDCQMPVMDGYEATRRIRGLSGSRGRTPVIALTAHASASDRVRCLESGMDDHLPKPILPHRLEEVLVRWYKACG